MKNLKNFDFRAKHPKIKLSSESYHNMNFRAKIIKFVLKMIDLWKYWIYEQFWLICISVSIGSSFSVRRSLLTVLAPPKVHWRKMTEAEKRAFNRLLTSLTSLKGIIDLTCCYHRPCDSAQRQAAVGVAKVEIYALCREERFMRASTAVFQGKGPAP